MSIAAYPRSVCHSPRLERSAQEPVTVFQQYCPVAKIRLAPLDLVNKTSIRIGSRFHGYGSLLFSAKVDISSRFGRLPLPPLARKLLGLAQASIKRSVTVKMFIRMYGLARSATR